LSKTYFVVVIISTSKNVYLSDDVTAVLHWNATTQNKLFVKNYIKYQNEEFVQVSVGNTFILVMVKLKSKYTALLIPSVNQYW